MLTLKKALRSAAAVAAFCYSVSCSEEYAPLFREESEDNRLVLNFDLPEYKSAGNSDEDKVSIIGIYLFDASGKLVRSRVLYDRQNKCEIVLDKGKYEYRILTGSAPGNINSIHDYDNLLVDFHANIYRDSYPGFAMTAGGSVEVHEGSNNVHVALTRLCSKLKIAEISVKNDIPDVNSLQVKRIYIHNAPTYVHTDGRTCGTDNGVFNWWDGTRMNFTSDESVFRCTVASLSGMLAAGQSIYPDTNLYCLPTKEPVNSGDFLTDSFLVLEMEATLSDGTTQLQYYRKAIHLKRNVEMRCQIAINGPGGSTPDITPPEGDDFECLITVLPWRQEDGYGYSDRLNGPMSYIFTSPAGGRDGSIHFNNLYGEPYVKSTDRNVLDVIGAGREWIVINTGKGRARLELWDGCNREYTQEQEY